MARLRVETLMEQVPSLEVSAEPVPTGRMGPIRVGVVDDTEDIRAMLRLTFELDERFEVVGEASNGVEAIEMAAEMQPDLLVLDRQMPVMGGIEALPELKRVAPEMAVVVFTAYADGGTAQAALAAGAADVREKTGLDDEFIDDLAALLVARAASGGGVEEAEVRIGPVPSSSAQVWIRNTLGLLRAIRAHRDELTIDVPDEALATFTRFLHQWLATATESETFFWAARAEITTVQSLMEHWGAIDRLTDDDLALMDCHWSPPEGQPFFEALTMAVLAALEGHAATQQLAGTLESQWRPFWSDNGDGVETDGPPANP